MSYKFYYWPVPFRGNFIRLLLEEANEKYSEATVDEIMEIKTKTPDAQPLPSMAPPFLHDLSSDLFLSQMPAIVMYLGGKLGFLPDDSYMSAICLKLVLDSNDVLAEITNLNGSMMWHHEKWKEFRGQRLKRWFRIFEQTGKTFGLKPDSGYMLGSDQISAADLTAFALWGTMTRCLPELSVDFQKHAPNLFALCQKIADRPNIRKFLDEQQKSYGDLYCGGHIEKSIRSMLKKDAEQ